MLLGKHYRSIAGTKPLEPLLCMLEGLLGKLRLQHVQSDIPEFFMFLLQQNHYAGGL